jgi:periplasmic protein TonB
MKNSTLKAAFIASLFIHAALLMIHFVSPSLPAAPVDPGLDVVLVNAKHERAPKKAQALAQANLDGGGNADQGRATSPLPDMRNSEDGDAVQQTQRRIQELENLQQHLLSQTTRTSDFKVASNVDKTKTETNKSATNGTDDTDTNKAITRLAAEIAQSIADQNKRPHKTFITPSTKAVGYALYYKNMQKRIEDIGTMQFPEYQGQKLYGELIVYIPIFQDGSIYEEEGGPRVEKSSGNAMLDEAALRIVRSSAPFGRFPDKMRSDARDDVWVVITRFKFTRDSDLKTELKDVG